jgi:hypothetical protein
LAGLAGLAVYFLKTFRKQKKINEYFSSSSSNLLSKTLTAKPAKELSRTFPQQLLFFSAAKRF